MDSTDQSLSGFLHGSLQSGPDPLKERVGYILVSLAEIQELLLRELTCSMFPPLLSFPTGKMRSHSPLGGVASSQPTKPLFSMPGMRILLGWGWIWNIKILQALYSDYCGPSG